MLADGIGGVHAYKYMPFISKTFSILIFLIICESGNRAIFTRNKFKF